MDAHEHEAGPSSIVEPGAYSGRSGCLDHALTDGLRGEWHGVRYLLTGGDRRLGAAADSKLNTQAGLTPSLSPKVVSPNPSPQTIS